jgi:hypothetical protein
MLSYSKSDSYKILFLTESNNYIVISDFLSSNKRQTPITPASILSFHYTYITIGSGCAFVAVFLILRI